MKPHSCFDQQIYSEACPFCGSNQNVFTGHGTTRHCADCVINWGQGETVAVPAQKAATVQNKVQSLPPAEKRRVNETRRGLRQASGLAERQRRLRAISPAEWERAQGGS